MKPMKLFGQLKQSPTSGTLFWIGDNKPMHGDEPVLLIPLSDTPESGFLQPQTALEILAREDHACKGAECGHCASVRVLATALFPLTESAAA